MERRRLAHPKSDQADDSGVFRLGLPCERSGEEHPLSSGFTLGARLPTR